MRHSVQISLRAVKSSDTILEIFLVSHVLCRVSGLSESQSDTEIPLINCYLDLDFMILHIFTNTALRLCVLKHISVLLHLTPHDILFQL